MYGDVEELVLSGKLLNGESPSSSPTRSRSSSPTSRWPEVNSDFESPDENVAGSDDDVLDELEDTSGFPKVNKSREDTISRESIGMKPGRTGVKGVIRDRREVVELERERRGRRIKELNKRMESMNLGGMTVEEEKAFDEEEEKRRFAEEEWDEMRRARKESRSGKFGHLREVGVTNFVSAIEDEDPNVWVVVHIYHQSLDRCIIMDNTLSMLARSHPSVKFVRTRAGALGFAAPSSQHRPPRIEDEDEEEEEEEEQPVDTDMLPTMLVYRDGQLIHNWVRVDWVIREQVKSMDMDIQSLLEKHGIIVRNARNQASASDDSLGIEFDHDLDY